MAHFGSFARKNKKIYSLPLIKALLLSADKNDPVLKHIQINFFVRGQV